MAKKYLPIGKQSFKMLREDEYVYIDKTKYIQAMIETDPHPRLFLARPRRFGKSLLVDTIRYLYEGKKEFFEGLYIYDKWDWDKTNPVLKIAWWDGTIQSGEHLNQSIDDMILENCRKFDITLQSQTTAKKFRELIKTLYEKTGRRVVVLIDEYDKPILDKITDIKATEDIKEELKGFYSVLKGADDFIEFIFITWVTTFSKVSLFSWLNNLKDISLKSEFANICWYTYQEITDNFSSWLEWVDRDKMKRWYNGFNFLWKEKVYNPYDVLLFFDSKKYRNHWFKTATPTFLIKLLKERNEFYHIPDLESLTVNKDMLDSFDIDKIAIETLLFQAGYLTIKEKYERFDKVKYKLKVPNHEIQMSLNDYIISDYLQAIDNVQKAAFGDKVIDSLLNRDIKKFIDLIDSLFAGIAYSSIQDICKYEWYYSSVIYSLLYSMWLSIVQEDITNKGRIDLTIKIEDYIYVLEFKVQKDGKKALEQIKDRGYSDKYKSEGKQIIELGINFDKESRQIDSFDYDEL